MFFKKMPLNKISLLQKTTISSWIKLKMLQPICFCQSSQPMYLRARSQSLRKTFSRTSMCKENQLIAHQTFLHLLKWRMEETVKKLILVWISLGFQKGWKNNQNTAMSHQGSKMKKWAWIRKRNFFFTEIVMKKS